MSSSAPGYDALIVHGKSEKPVYLWIKDDDGGVRSAEAYWGKDTADVEWAIQEELDDDRIRVAQCGIAGENQVLYANVIHDINRAAGRGGWRSHGQQESACSGRTRHAAAAHRRTKTGDAGLQMAGLTTTRPSRPGRVEMGTPRNSSIHWPFTSGCRPVTFSIPFFEEHEQISGELMHETILISRDTCQACPIAVQTGGGI